MPNTHLSEGGKYHFTWKRLYVFAVCADVTVRRSTAEIAGVAGMSRERANVVLNELKRRDFVRKIRGRRYNQYSWIVTREGLDVLWNEVRRKTKTPVRDDSKTRAILSFVHRAVVLVGKLRSYEIAGWCIWRAMRSNTLSKIEYVIRRSERLKDRDELKKDQASYIAGSLLNPKGDWMFTKNRGGQPCFRNRIRSVRPNGSSVSGSMEPRRTNTWSSEPSLTRKIHDARTNPFTRELSSKRAE